MTLFGGLALLLAAVGLYGVTAYGVARRTSEIGIRMALGAERSGVVAMILRIALLQTVIGLAIGVPVAYYGVTLVKSQLYETTTVSGGALAVGTLLAAACVAGLIPARRAASVDPARALGQNSDIGRDMFLVPCSVESRLRQNQAASIRCSQVSNENSLMSADGTERS